MSRDNFLQRKQAVLSKSDKSSIGKWDEKIKSLCDKINSDDNFYTTSSCSGRVVLMVEQEKKSPDLFLEVSHDIISYDWIKKSLKKISDDKKFKNKLIKFKLEQPILHIICRDLTSASEILDKALHIGFRRSGINSVGKRILLELNSTERLEFPIIQNGKVLVDEDFLKLIVQLSNEKLETGWRKIERLQFLTEGKKS
jgi:tRNA wybutosine-synthesizing protein 3